MRSCVSSYFLLRRVPSRRTPHIYYAKNLSLYPITKINSTSRGTTQLM